MPVAQYIARIDQAVLAAVQKGQRPDVPEIFDWPAFFQCFAKRQATNKNRAMAASLRNAVFRLYQMLGYLFYITTYYFTYE